MNEGVIKFKYVLKKKPLPAFLNLNELVKYRNRLYKDGLIGADKNGVGYGNISVRYKDSDEFIVSCSDTGSIKRAGKLHFAIVNSVDVKKNFVSCKGMRAASSESMTHYIIYKLSAEIRCVIHVHNMRMWKKLLDKVPTTDKGVSYGTPEMAYNILRLWNYGSLKEERVLAMAGHDGGLVVFGESADAAYEIVREWYGKKERG